jgi:putative transposase
LTPFTLACDFFTVETAWLKRIYVLFFISLDCRRIEFVACTPSPTGAWVAQQARNLLMTLDDRGQQFRFLIHDRDAKFSGGCDHVFQSEAIAVIRTPVRAPNANAHAERWVGSVRRECLDRLLIFRRRQLEHVLRVYTRHYNQHRPHRPHRALALRPPEQADRSATPPRAPPYAQLTRTDLLGGLIHEYRTRGLTGDQPPYASTAPFAARPFSIFTLIDVSRARARTPDLSGQSQTLPIRHDRQRPSRL